MPVDPAALRPLLAGPVLRRVESDLVSVWIATSRACNVSLLLFDGADIVASRNEQDDLRAKWVSVPQPTVQVGAHLHVLTVVLDLRTPGGNASRAAGTTLEANHTFSYDLQLIERADPTKTHNLRSLGLVADPTPIGYDPEELPSFRTCPQELDRLVILHGSCRQLFAAPPLADEAENDPLPGDTEIDDEKFVPPGIDPRANPTFPNWPRERPTVDSPRHDGKPLSSLFVAASPAETIEGLPLEEVHLLADEVANVAWAVERLTPHPLGDSREAAPHSVAAAPATPPGLTWTLTPPSPPGNWFPLLPMSIGRLALGSLWNARDLKPAGRVLSDLRSPRLLHQEEVPPEGAQIVRRWQSARAIDGSLHFWIGRSKTPRRTDIPPAIRFDIVEWK